MSSVSMSENDGICERVQSELNDEDIIDERDERPRNGSISSDQSKKSQKIGHGFPSGFSNAFMGMNKKKNGGGLKEKADRLIQGKERSNSVMMGVQAGEDRALVEPMI